MIFPSDILFFVRFIDPPRKDDLSRGAYRLAVFSGVQDLERGGSLRVSARRCGLIGCLNDSLSSCGLRPDQAAVLTPLRVQDRAYGGLVQTGTEFLGVEIRAALGRMRPNLLLAAPRGDNFGALPQESQFSFTTSGNITRLSIKRPISNLMVAAIEETKPSTAKPKLSYEHTWTNAV